MAKKKTSLKSRAKTAYGLLSEIAKLALDEPKRLRMGTYLSQRNEYDPEDPPHIGVQQWPACGTIGCIAGWAKFLTDAPSNGEGMGEVARRVLGLSHEQATELFHDEALVHDDERGTKAHAKAAVRHLRAFQKANAAQLKTTRVRS